LRGFGRAESLLEGPTVYEIFGIMPPTKTDVTYKVAPVRHKFTTITLITNGLVLRLEL